MGTTTKVKNNDTAKADAMNDMAIENVELDVLDVEEIDDVENVEDTAIDSHEYPAKDNVDLDTEYKALMHKSATGEEPLSDAEEDRLMALMAQRKANKTGKTIKEITSSTNAKANAIVTDEIEASHGAAMDTYKLEFGGATSLAESFATVNGVSVILNGPFAPTTIQAGAMDTATGKFTVQWAETGRLTFNNQRRYYVNQLLMLDKVEQIAIKTGVAKGKLEGNVARDESGQITNGASTIVYTAKVSGGTTNVNRSGGSTATTTLPDGATLWMKEDYTVEIPGYGTATVPAFSNAKIRNLFDAKKVPTGTFKADNIKRNEGPFQMLALAYKNLGYYDSKLGPLTGAATSYDGTILKALCQVGVNDNYLLAQKIVIKVDGSDDMTIAEFDAKIKGLMA